MRQFILHSFYVHFSCFYNLCIFSIFLLFRNKQSQSLNIASEKCKYTIPHITSHSSFLTFPISNFRIFSCLRFCHQWCLIVWPRRLLKSRIESSKVHEQKVKIKRIFFVFYYFLCSVLVELYFISSFF